MHKVRRLIKQINRTHKGLGPMIGTNIVAAKAKRCVLNCAPAGCGKSAATDIVHMLMKGLSQKYTSLTLAGLVRLKDELTGYTGSIIIDDLGSEKSLWSRVSTITVLANLVHTHYVKKVTHTSLLEITNFQGAAALNIQPVLMNSLVQDSDWIAVVRDKVLRYYHLIRPLVPKARIPRIEFDWGKRFEDVYPPTRKGKLWVQLLCIGLTQWSYARCLEHLPAMLRACAALDDRTRVKQSDYHLLIKLLKPMQLERYIVTSYGFEEGRNFQNNVYCILVELASHGEPTVLTIAEDYKVSPQTVERLVATAPQWCWVKANSPRKVMPKDDAKKILEIVGVNQRW